MSFPQQTKAYQISDLPLKYTLPSPSMISPHTHTNTHSTPLFTNKQSDIPLARQSRGISLSVVTIHAKNYQCHSSLFKLVHLMRDPLLTKVILSICIPLSQGIQFVSMHNLIVIPHSLHLPDQYGHTSGKINITTKVKSRTIFFNCFTLM